jgi:hypothetical protein
MLSETQKLVAILFSGIFGNIILSYWSVGKNLMTNHPRLRRLLSRAVDLPGGARKSRQVCVFLTVDPGYPRARARGRPRPVGRHSGDV